jgi:outer membrane protein OmpA-like peptidoglycan-associated protein
MHRRSFVLAVTVALIEPALAQDRRRRVHIFFDWNQSTLTPKGIELVQVAADAAKQFGSNRVLVTGFTDTSMPEAQSKALSYSMADAVAAQLVEDGVPREVLRVEGLGWSRPLIETGPGVREPQNRRVEIDIE